MNYKQAILQITGARREAVEAYGRRVDEALGFDAEYYAAETALRALLFDEASGKEVDKTKKTALMAEKRAAEKRLNLICPPPVCPKCGDTGFCGGKICACVVNLALASNNDVGLPLHEFSELDYGVFPSAQREKVQRSFERVRKVVEGYPALKTRILLVTGSTGTGKTYLAGCAASAGLRRGMSVAGLTAFALNNRFLKYHTTFDENKTSYLDPLIDSDLLLIDDLGTESVLKNVTLEYLYMLLNERLLKNKLTMITANLTPAALMDRYGERIVSRLLDRRLCYSTSLTGFDLRLGGAAKKSGDPGQNI